jgi:CBS domain-containing protein
MTSELLSPAPSDVARIHSGPGKHHDPLLDREVAEFMTPGCVVISEAASVADAAKAMAALNQSSNPRNSALNPGTSARRERTRKPRGCRHVVVSTGRERSACHAEGRGFESLQPL